MTDPGWACQKAIYQALESALVNVSPPLVTGVFDGAAPQDTIFPYVTINQETTVTTNFLAARKEDRFIYLSVWSEYRGKKEVREIISAIDTALEGKRLPMDTGQMVICRIERYSINNDSDNLTFTGSVTLSVITTR